ncbi:Galectin carbohydrate recognition domain [Arabidopsis suecica]|uniref:Galectin carbohydrate recognition domain n=1 Tax=Arabidopsis suecica TaxID=45249 RepID=A0A8T2CJ69_ARASU|nr:Galectin carbohydrate recognition domain [Arabidopsis suecica]
MFLLLISRGNEILHLYSRLLALRKSVDHDFDSSTSFYRCSGLMSNIAKAKENGQCCRVRAMLIAHDDELSSSMNKKLMMMMPFSKEWLSSSMNKKSWLNTLKNLSLVGGMSRAAHNRRPVPPAAPALLASSDGLVGSFRIDLTGQPLPGEPDPPIIVHYNVRLLGDKSTEDPVIVQNSWTA